MFLEKSYFDIGDSVVDARSGIKWSNRRRMDITCRVLGTDIKLFSHARFAFLQVLSTLYNVQVGSMA